MKFDFALYKPKPLAKDTLRLSSQNPPLLVVAFIFYICLHHNSHPTFFEGLSLVWLRKAGLSSPKLLLFYFLGMSFSFSFLFIAV